jgi:signal transduction histidine kinase
MSWLFFNSKKSLSSNPTSNSVSDGVINYVRTLINRSDLIEAELAKLKASNKLTQIEREIAYVKCYLALEDFAVRNKPLVVKREIRKEELREEIRNKLPIKELVAPFRLIFLPKPEQTFFILGIGLGTLVSYIVENLGLSRLKLVLGKALKNTVLKAALTDSGTINYDGEFHFKKTKFEQIQTDFQTLYKTLYVEISQALGQKNAQNIFSKIIDYVKSTYDYDIISQFIDVMPKEVVSDQNLFYLSRQELEQKIILATTDLKLAKEQVEKQVEQRTLELNQEHARLLASIDSLSLGYVMLDAELRVLISNQALNVMFERSNYTWNIDNFESLFNYKLNLYAKVKQVLKLKHSMEIKIDHELKYFRVFIQPVLDVESDLLGVVLLFEDITHDQEIDHAKSEFVSLASHQLRTPLSIINWYAETILDGHVAKLEPQLKQYVEKIYTGNKRLIRLVNTLLNITRIETNTFNVTPIETNVVKLCATIISELKLVSEDNNIKIVENYEQRLPKLPLDQTLMSIALDNLVTNAIKYTPAGGKITVSIKLKKINLKTKSLVISVADTGIGIPKTDKDKIFTKMFRSDNAKIRDTQGTGLGLYMVKSILDRTGGKVWFESEENSGTTFYLELPLTGMRQRVGNKILDLTNSELARHFFINKSNN